MKKTEIATIIFVASLSMIATYFIANAIIGKQAALSASVKTADPLPSLPRDVTLSKQFFNKDALNPTVEVYVDADNSSSNTVDNSLSSSKPSDADSTQTDTNSSQTSDTNTSDQATKP